MSTVARGLRIQVPGTEINVPLRAVAVALYNDTTLPAGEEKPVKVILALGAFANGDDVRITVERVPAPVMSPGVAKAMAGGDRDFSGDPPT